MRYADYDRLSIRVIFRNNNARLYLNPNTTLYTLFSLYHTSAKNATPAIKIYKKKSCRTTRNGSSHYLRLISERGLDVYIDLFIVAGEYFIDTLLVLDLGECADNGNDDKGCYHCECTAVDGGL